MRSFAPRKRSRNQTPFVVIDPGRSIICLVLFTGILVELMCLMGEGASVKANGTRPKAQKLLRTNPIRGLQKSKVLRLDLGSATVDKELDTVDEAGIAGREEKSDRRDLLRASHLAAWDLGFEELLGVVS